MAFHVLQLLMIFNKISLLPTKSGDDKSGLFWMCAGILLALISISFIVKERDLQILEYDELTIKRGWVYIIIYIVLSFTLFVLLGLYGPR